MFVYKGNNKEGPCIKMGFQQIGNFWISNQTNSSIYLSFFAFPKLWEGKVFKFL